MLRAISTGRSETKREIKAAITAGLRKRLEPGSGNFHFFNFSSSNIFHRPIRLKAPTPSEEGRKAFLKTSLCVRVCVCIH